MKRNQTILLSVILLFIFSACQPQQDMHQTSSQMTEFGINASGTETVAVSLPVSERDTVNDIESKAETLTSAVSHITSVAAENTIAAEIDISEDRVTVEIIKSSESLLDKSFTAYKRLDFFYNETMESYIEAYTQAEVDENGEVWWDDSNAIAAIAVIGESSFLIFPEEYVQLGEPKFSVFESEDRVLHILLEDKRSAQYTVYDFVYDIEKNQFEKNVIIDFPGCNFWGTI